MKEIPQGKDLEDLIIQYATVLAGNEQLCNLMLRQEEIAYDDPMGGSRYSSRAELGQL
ncbi:hypothetical protein QW131_15380 [Roseibium salinum]|nr:hypothetical protein [Roseibium salinum]